MTTRTVAISNPIVRMMWECVERGRWFQENPWIRKTTLSLSLNDWHAYTRAAQQRRRASTDEGAASPLEMTNQDVIRWLASRNLAALSGLFRAHHVQGRSLAAIHTLHRNSPQQVDGWLRDELLGEVHGDMAATLLKEIDALFGDGR